MSENLPVTDADIADFREAHSEALYSNAHPLHGQRVQELSALFERKFVAPAEIAAPDGTSAEFRARHNDALLNRSHPDHDVRTQELTAIHQRDAVGGNEPGDSLDVPAKAEDFDFDRFKATVQAPMGEELVPDAELEQQARTWMAEGGLSKIEGEAMASVYGQSLSWTESDVASIANTTAEGLRMQFGDRVPEVAAAALKVADEAGVLPFLESTGMINHHMVVGRLIDAASKRGYFSKGN